MTISFLSTPPKPSSIVPHLFSRFFFLFVALIFFLSPRQRAPVVPWPLPTTPSAQRRRPEMAPRAPEAAHSPHYDVLHCCSSARCAASAPPAAPLLLHPPLPLPRPPPLLLRQHEQMVGSRYWMEQMVLHRCSALPNWSHGPRPACPPAIRREERH